MIAISKFMMTAAVATGAAVLATAAFASTGQLTDSQFIAAAHCQGLFDSKALGPVDATHFDKMMRAQGEYRLPQVLDMAGAAHSSALQAARSAGKVERTALVSERDGACGTWVADAKVANGR